MFLPVSRAAARVRCTSAWRWGPAHIQHTRAYASASQQPNSRLFLLFAIGTAGGLGGYLAWARYKHSATHSPVENGVQAFHPEEYRNFTIKRIEPHNHDTSVYVFALPDDQKSGAFVASAVSIMGADGTPKKPDGDPLARGYTPISAPHVPGEFELLIKHYPEGLMTQHLASLKPGDSILVKGPREKYPYKPNEFEHIGMIAGGTGIAPMWQILDAIASNPDDKTKATLLFGNKSEADILLREKLDALGKDDRFKIIYYLDKSPSGWQGGEGYITQEAIQQHLPPPSSKTKIFYSGPRGLNESINGPKRDPSDTSPRTGILPGMGYSVEQIHKF